MTLATAGLKLKKVTSKNLVLKLPISLLIRIAKAIDSFLKKIAMRASSLLFTKKSMMLIQVMLFSITMVNFQKTITLALFIPNMTYKRLIEKLQLLPPERLNDTVTVWNAWDDEFTPVCGVTENKEGSEILDTNVLDYGHAVLELSN